MSLVSPQRAVEGVVLGKTAYSVRDIHSTAHQQMNSRIYRRYECGIPDLWMRFADDLPIVELVATSGRYRTCQLVTCF